MSGDRAPFFRPPWRLEGTALPPHLLGAAQALFLLCLTSGIDFPEPLAPLWPFLDLARGRGFWSPALRLAFACGGFLLLASRWVRTGCLLLAVALGLQLLSSHATYRNADLFKILLFALLACHEAHRPRSRYIPYQLALVYFGAGLNKACLADWRSGRFFEYWQTQLDPSPAYVWMADLFPPFAFSKTICLTVIATEFLLAGLLLHPKTRGKALLLGFAFHGMALAMTGRSFGTFHAAILISYLMLFDWTTPLSAANGRETRFTRWLAAGWTHPGMPVAVGLLHYPNGLGSLQTLYFRLLTAACLLVLILRFRLLRLRQEPAPTRI